ncbi:MAG: hypothetical protein HY769_08080 [Candidatus Stahlbacteria bacterium]|nr:hypothetical protein [Candidatus Stahlbacteria bacterium]
MATIEPAFMRDLHKIREKMYNEMKGLSWDKKIERIRREAQKFLREQEYKVKPAEKKALSR